MPNVLPNPREMHDGGRTATPSVTMSSEDQRKECSICGISSPVDRRRIAAAPQFVCYQCTRGESINPVAAAPSTALRSRGTEEIVREEPIPTANDVADQRRGSITAPTLVTKPTPYALQVPPSPSAKASLTPTSPTIVYPHVLNSAFNNHLQHQTLLSPVPSLTNIRIPSKGYDCIYPGALFE
ncbi:hypothetical protein FRC17_008109, partial [Serendipita sp. 399]